MITRCSPVRLSGIVDLIGQDEGSVIEMQQWTWETVKAETDYRRELATHGIRPEHLRALRSQRRSWWRRVRQHHG